MSAGDPGSTDAEQQIPDKHTHSAFVADRRLRAFDIDMYRPNDQLGRSWISSRRSKTTEHSADNPIFTYVPKTRESAGSRVWRILLIGMCLLLLVGIGRFIVWRMQDPYPGVSQCHQIELWLYGVESEGARIGWAVEDAEQEVSNDAEAKEATARIDQMFTDLRTSIANSPAPEEVTELKALWLQVIDLVLQISDANQRGDSESAASLKKEWNMAHVQRMDEQKRVLGDCRLQIKDTP